MTKTISLADDAYEALSKARRPGESFSEVARRLTRLEAERTFFDRTIRLNITDAEAAAWQRKIRRDRDATLKPRVEFDSR